MPPSSELDLFTELRAAPVFAEMPRDALVDLAAAMQQLRVHANTPLVEQGTVATSLFFLLRGAAKTVRVAAAGTKAEETVVLDVTRGPQLLVEASIFDGEPALASLVTLRSSQVAALDRRGLGRLTQLHPSLPRALVTRLARDLRAQTRRLDDLVAGPVDERIRGLFDSLAEQHGTPLGQGRFIAIPLRRRDVACMVHATTETVSRLLAKFEREGQARSTRDGIWWRTVPGGKSPPDAAIYSSAIVGVASSRSSRPPPSDDRLSSAPPSSSSLPSPSSPLPPLPPPRSARD
jgi:CRP-like cAMP-binding protein